MFDDYLKVTKKTRVLALVFDHFLKRIPLKIS